MEEKIRISVIIPTKDRFDEIRRCIKSILNQTVVPHEIVVVDSSRKKVLDSLIRETFPHAACNIRYFHYKGSNNMARNMGIRQSTGDILFFFDDDVVLDKDYVKEIMKVLERDKDDNIAGVTGRITNIPRDMPVFSTAFRRVFFLGYFGDGKFLPSGIATSVQHMNKITQTSFLSGCGMAYRAKIFRNFSFDEDLGRHSGYCYRDDVDFSYRVSRKYTLIYTPFAKLQHLKTKTARGNPILIKRQQIFNFHYLFKKNMPKHLTNLVAFCLSVIGLLLLSISQKNARETAGILRGILDVTFNYQ